MSRSRLMFRLPLMALLALFAACGEDDPAAPAASAVGDATMRVGDDGAPVEGAVVIHQDPDGAVLASGVSDAAGAVSLEIIAGDMVTAVMPPDSGGRVRLHTVVGVEPDDEIVTYRTSEDRPPTSDVVVFTGEIAEPRDTFIFGTGCSSGGGRVVFPYDTGISDACRSASGLLHVQVHTYLDNQKQAFAYVTDVPFDPSGTTTIDFTGRWRTDWQTVTLNLPTPAFAVGDLYVTPWPERDGAQFYNLETLGWHGQGVAPVQHELLLPRGFVEHIETNVSFDGTEGGQVDINQRFAVDEQTSALSFAVEPPVLEVGDYDATDPARPVLDWTVDTNGNPGDGVVLALWWSNEGVGYSWTIHLPPNRRSCRLPELPASLATARPPVPAVGTESGAWVEFRDDSFVDGYSAYRNDLFEEDGYWGRRGQAGYWVGASGSFDLPGGGEFKGRSGRPEDDR